MGRVSRAQAEENRRQVVAIASRMFREKGTAVSIADLMKTAGLSHGAFYKQFASKDDLVDEAIAHAFEDPAAHAPAALEEPAGEHEAARRTLIEQYLSVWHLRHGDETVGTLALEAVDMFWSDCRFEPSTDWPLLAPLIDASREAWQRGDEDAAIEADEAIYALGLVLVPVGGGEAITDFLLRIDGNTARLRH